MLFKEAEDGNSVLPFLDTLKELSSSGNTLPRAAFAFSATCSMADSSSEVLLEPMTS
jgi:hypothetical protein